MVKDIIPASRVQRIIAVAAISGVAMAGIAIVLFDFGFLGGLFLGAVVAVMVGVVLAIGWHPQAHDVPDTPADTAKTPTTKDETAPAAVAAPLKETPKSGAKAGGKPTLLKAPRAGGADDLKQIKGVGPKLEKTLHDMGVFHFDQIAAWGPAEQAWMDDNMAGFKGRATRDDWVAQAKTLAAGGTTEFSSKVKKGGVY